MKSKSMVTRKKLPRMILSIDVTEPEIVKLSLDNFKHEYKSTRLSETLLSEIQKLIKKNKLTLQNIHEIKVNKGPGHFSRIRTAVATANALAFGLNLNQKIVKPIYDKAPNITLAGK